MTQSEEWRHTINREENKEKQRETENHEPRNHTNEREKTDAYTSMYLLYTSSNRVYAACMWVRCVSETSSTSEWFSNKQNWQKKQRQKWGADRSHARLSDRLNSNQNAGANQTLTTTQTLAHTHTVPLASPSLLLLTTRTLATKS